VRVTDNHAHANPVKGLGFVEVARRFREAGGVAMVFAPLLSWHYSVSIASSESYSRVFEMVLRGARDASAHVKALAVLGVHPAEVVMLVEGFGVERALEIVERAMRLAARYVEEGLATGLGEVGRPHYEAPKPALDVCNKVLDLSLELAKDLNCPIHLHLERGHDAIRDVVERVRKVGIRPSLVVIHHAEPRVVGRCGGLTPSVPRRGKSLREAFAKGSDFLVESDFVDDPKRPGVVSYPWAIALEVSEMLREGFVSEEVVERVFIENFEKLYGVELC
jgi:TatD-related deoxyribonuclease